MAFTGRRPEHGGPPELFYDEKEARKYVPGRAGGRPQSQLLGKLRQENGINPGGGACSRGPRNRGRLLLGDMGQGIPFKPGTFDGCISISAVQWLCNANKKSENPAKRLYCFFASLFSALVRGSRAVLQLYPENSEQLELITTQATKAGFSGGMVVDYPNSAKAKKFYLCLFSGPSTFIPEGLSENQDEAEPRESVFTNERFPFRMSRRGMVRKSRAWVLEKKERHRRQGREVRPDTQYTGRKRKPRF
uniref:BUD23 rRNA methyltransferase and ribosome maturation factor n=1 Tax=Nomascus leucogenys TaxID=61853 RepID=A0A2I3HWA1_NOMLE